MFVRSLYPRVVKRAHCVVLLRQRPGEGCGTTKGGGTKTVVGVTSPGVACTLEFCRERLHTHTPMLGRPPALCGRLDQDLRVLEGTWRRIDGPRNDAPLQET